jgi:adenylate cyclase
MAAARRKTGPTRKPRFAGGLGWMRLRFRDPETEAAFQAAFAPDLRQLSQITAVVLAALCLAAAFAHREGASSLGLSAAIWSWAITLPFAGINLLASAAPVTPSLRQAVSAVLYAAIYASACAAFSYLANEPGGAGQFAAPFAVVLGALMTIGGFAVGWAALAGIVMAVAPVVVLAQGGGLTVFTGGAFALAFILGLSATLLVERLKRGQFKAGREADLEKEKSDDLVYAVLPDFAVTRLKAGETRIAHSFQDLGVLFSDLAGFTQLSGQLGAVKTVEILDDIFGQFDDAVERLGLERVKTIGDGYMAVANRNRNAPNDLRPLADLALEIRRLAGLAAMRYSLPIEVRVGLHCGPAIGGVIGRRRPQFDYWGETINIAARLESAGQTGEITVSPKAHARLKGEFAFVSGGTAKLKGVGEIEVQKLTGRLALAQKPSAQGAGSPFRNATSAGTRPGESGSSGFV